MLECAIIRNGKIHHLQQIIANLDTRFNNGRKEAAESVCLFLEQVLSTRVFHGL